MAVVRKLFKEELFNLRPLTFEIVLLLQNQMASI